MPGLNMNLSSLSDPTKVIWMDPSLWSTLPESLLELILARLPLPELLPMRGVSTKWNTLLRTLSFLTKQRALTVQCPAYVLTVNEPALSAFSFFQQSTGPELYYLQSSSLYCPVAKNWFNMSLDYLPIQDFYITSVGGGLLCFVGYKGGSRNNTLREVVLGVCNPATRAWRILPHWSDAKAYTNLPDFVAMVVDTSTNAYRILLIDRDRSATWSYQSGSMAWTQFQSVPPRHSFPYYDRSPSTAVMATNSPVLVCANECTTGISTFHMETGFWECYVVNLPGLHNSMHLVEDHGRILMISRVMKQKYEGSDRVQISELDPEGLKGTTALEEVPLGPSKQFLDHFKVCAHRGYDESGGLCFISITTGERWLYDLEKRLWHILPTSPGSKMKSMAAYGGFTVHLRVDIQP